LRRRLQQARLADAWLPSQQQERRRHGSYPSVSTGQQVIQRRQLGTAPHQRNQPGRRAEMGRASFLSHRELPAGRMAQLGAIRLGEIQRRRQEIDSRRAGILADASLQILDAPRTQRRSLGQRLLGQPSCSPVASQE